MEELRAKAQHQPAIRSPRVLGPVDQKIVNRL
jgi:hypothetical protein